MSLGGREHELRDGSYVAVITEVGAGLRVLQHQGRDLVRSYASDQVRPRYAGSLLAPWPNRIADGAYEFDGESHQLPLTEPERGNALHGLVIWDRFQLEERTASSVTLTDDVVARTGYPFEVTVQVSYTLEGSEGLRTTVTALNTGQRPAPWGTAGHPYLQAGTPHVDTCTLTVPASQVLRVTEDRLLPLDVVAVEGSELDFGTPAPIGDRFVDHAYTGLRADPDGLARVRMTSPEGGVQMTWDPVVLPWVQVHTADNPGTVSDRTGLAVEPMTCAPDAFNSGRDLVVLQPGERHTASWTISGL